jgi:diguanylate cyclase (GGDEF)-like protein
LKSAKQLVSAALTPAVQRLVRRLGIEVERFDELTGLPTRSHLVKTLGRQVAQIHPAGRIKSVTVLYLDLNNLKYLNDTYGHETCNSLLQAFARRLQSAVGAKTCLVRMHGDEFAAVIPNLRDEMAASERAFEICRAVTGHYQIGDETFYLEVTVGFVWSDTPLSALQDQVPQSRGEHMVLVDRADRAMLAAKELTNVHYRVARYREEHWLEQLCRHARITELRKAIAGGHFTLAYQPLTNLSSGRIVGAEVLIRPHGDWQPVSLAADIALLEDSALIDKLWPSVARQACFDLASWCKTDPGLSSLYISLNLSPGQLMSDGALAVLDDVSRLGVDPRQVVLELTERQNLEPDDDVLARLVRLRQLGHRLVFDDFAERYGWLNRLLKLDLFSGLKIDQHLVSGILTDQRTATMVRWIIQLADDLKLEVTAEGIETSAQARQLLEWNCRVGQGHLFGAPMTSTQFGDLLCRRTSNPRP